MTDEPYVTVRDVATHFGISTDTAYTWARTPGFPVLNVARPGSKRPTYRFRLGEIHAYLEQQRANTDPWAMPPASRRKRRAA